MKYDTEAEFCADTTKMILGLLIGENRNVIACPEVPWGYYSNEQVDMLLLDVKNQEWLPIEYKLSDLRGLKYQVQRRNGGMGIINSKTTDSQYNIFGYTGEHAQIEKIAQFLCYNKRFWWRSIYTGYGMMYYWAYKERESSFDGGIAGGGREGFASVYKQALRNLLANYPLLDFHVAHAVFRAYSVATGKKYYRDVVRLMKDDQ